MALKDESYWRNADGSISDEGSALGEEIQRRWLGVNGKSLKPSVANSDNPLNDDGYCTSCLDEKGKPPIMRELIQIGETTKQKLAVRVCKECDSDAYDISERR